MVNETVETTDMETTEQQQFEMGESDMNTQKEVMCFVEEESFLGRNKGAIGAAAGVGIAGFTGGFFTGKMVERKKNMALINAIQYEISNFMQVIEGKAEGNIEELYAFKNAEDIKFKILEKLDESKGNEKMKARWRMLLDSIVMVAVKGREEQLITDRTVVAEVREETL